MNARPVDVLRGSSFTPTPWRDVCVGDVVRVRDRDAFPADLVLLSSSATGRNGPGGGGGSGSGGGGGDSGNDGGGAAAAPSSTAAAAAFPPPPLAEEGSTSTAEGDQHHHQQQQHHHQQQQQQQHSSAPSHGSSCPAGPPLSSSFPTGVAFVETANLDGETNLKMRQALPQTAGLLSAAEIFRATTGIGSDGGRASAEGSGGSGEAPPPLFSPPPPSSSSSSAAPATPSQPRPSLLRIECEQPNSAIYRFQGVLVTPEGERLPLSPNQVSENGEEFFFLRRFLFFFLRRRGRGRRRFQLRLRRRPAQLFLPQGRGDTIERAFRNDLGCIRPVQVDSLALASNAKETKVFPRVLLTQCQPSKGFG